jgi:hypothetical protein
MEGLIEVVGFIPDNTTIIFSNDEHWIIQV